MGWEVIKGKLVTLCLSALGKGGCHKDHGPAASTGKGQAAAPGAAGVAAKHQRQTAGGTGTVDSRVSVVGICQSLQRVFVVCAVE